ncbi:hypothetical protein L226DRAFT_537941 [Lentinus tigrinus ALCF2SS1-7]|uniref:SUN domain-containing protein n=1 Tax=Lentinus tigrinus ALCF2SS1-6 TaxID=1328759 RepID=A0A5C2RZU9_9APHY|nr:hypothetical protein L227DRAFT_655987 [Lentinus tigrinus ALCF2SS1-6]RPD71672.1 hypothetical protein L226DRAFT_537941 [Lentinus tigrinus ALCF2SS1-7]
MFSLLPTSLLALLLASPALTALTTPNDPFHDIVVQAPKQPEEPVCCLRPLAPLEPAADDDILLSFEDWKAKRLSEAKEQQTTPPVSVRAENFSESTIPADTSHTPQAQGSPALDVQEGSGPEERLEPHFRIPITDRFNYASLDCSARVHAAHKSSKSASSILSSKKDRYMLSPCSEKNQYVIVELCEDIRIDTVQLANYEFFSGVFKDFSVSVSKTYTTKPEEWTPAGTYRARNVRGVQSFHPPPTLRDFYRYIRIDFHSHYGSEYYCPVSLLRVYGLTHLDAWQWETWEAESRAKRSAEEASPPVEVVADPPTPAHTPVIHSDDADVISQTIVTSDDSSSSGIPVTSDILDSLQYDIYTSSNIIDIPKTLDAATLQGQEVMPPAKAASEDATYDSARPHTDHLYNTHVSLSTSSHAHSTVSDNHSTSIFIDTHSDSISHAHPHSSPTTRSSAATPNASALSTLSPSHVPPPAPPVSTGGESIYRTIMNRLTALEANTTLYARYVEEQTAGMREVLRRLTEDIGRLEGIGKAQAQLYQRSYVELEKQTRRLEDEQRELLHRVNYLTDEVVLEKRLGIAQLCLLLTVLVFMALTRGSRGEYAHPPGARTAGSMREWGRRTLSLSGGLVNRLRTRSSTPPPPVIQNPRDNEVMFPSVAGQTSESDDLPRSRRSHVGGSSKKALARPHTPTSIRTPTNRHFVHHRPGIPTSPSHHASGSRPAIQRSSSGGIALAFGGIGPVPKSAKRWARTAHLHEVKVTTPRRRGQAGGDNTPVPSTSGAPARGIGVFDADADDANTQVLVLPAAIERSETITLGKGKGRIVAASMRQPSPLRPALEIDLSSPPLRGRSLASSEGDASEGDAWVDTDVDGSECDSVVEAAPQGMVPERTSVARNSL